MKKYAISLLIPSLEYTNLLLQRREEDIRTKIAALGGSAILEKLMDQLSLAYSHKTN